jgi:catechol 2,3-dioxygenase-like lactoylglutathione lyase family enzyme
MDTHENPRYNGSVFFVDNVEKSRTFYTDILGQKIEMDFGRCVGFIGGFAIWDSTYACEMMGLGTSDERPLGKRNVELYFEIEDIKALFDSLQKENIDFVHEIIEQPWGQRCFRIYDPDSHIIEFGEPMPIVIQRFSRQGLSNEEIVEKTLMPMEIVKKVLGES